MEAVNASLALQQFHNAAELLRQVGRPARHGRCGVLLHGASLGVQSPGQRCAPHIAAPRCRSQAGHMRCSCMAAARRGCRACRPPALEAMQVEIQAAADAHTAAQMT